MASSSRQRIVEQSLPLWKRLGRVLCSRSKLDCLSVLDKGPKFFAGVETELSAEDLVKTAAGKAKFRKTLESLVVNRIFTRLFIIDGYAHDGIESIAHTPGRGISENVVVNLQSAIQEFAARLSQLSEADEITSVVRVELASSICEIDNTLDSFALRANCCTSSFSDELTYALDNASSVYANDGLGSPVPKPKPRRKPAPEPVMTSSQKSWILRNFGGARGRSKEEAPYRRGLALVINAFEAACKNHKDDLVASFTIRNLRAFRAKYLETYIRDAIKRDSARAAIKVATSRGDSVLKAAVQLVKNARSHRDRYVPSIHRETKAQRRERTSQPVYEYPYQAPSGR